MKKHICCIGGGHGLGRLLSALDCTDWSLSGIVATTDNGGSTGRLREYNETIAWGDLRNCFSQLSKSSDTASLLFEHRFENSGDLSGHSLGNLMLMALNQLCVRPTDCISVVRDFLNISPSLYPMSDTPTTLMGKTSSGVTLEGELNVDDSSEGICELWLMPTIETGNELIKDIKKSDLIILGPGSFYTSIMPGLLIKDIVDAINNSKGKLLFIGNISPEQAKAASNLTIGQQLSFINNQGIEKDIHILWPEHRKDQICREYNVLFYPFQQDSAGMHFKKDLYKAILDII